MECISCKTREVKVIFECPKCKKAIARCEKCRRLGIEYHCECCFSGP